MWLLAFKFITFCFKLNCKPFLIFHIKKQENCFAGSYNLYCDDQFRYLNIDVTQSMSQLKVTFSENSLKPISEARLIMYIGSNEFERVRTSQSWKDLRIFIRSALLPKSSRQLAAIYPLGPKECATEKFSKDSI